ncbi:hypothetical protein [Tenggerimyces flavus]|uniref:Uncharacterized protein n=1 Tax=Tenggerimyces flavus TaxID=1708749 RepID=A0ABV7YHY3_9ACTN|nr:hypothetical protein [Tenggerimyces flavus]MBM7790942.1 hypothetical protein [Tenggerimyces flavus]
MSDDYWYIDIPGLSYERAVRIRELLLPDSPFGVLLIDPSKSMLRGYDRAAVELLVKGMEAILAADNLDREDRMGAMSMLEDYQDWLEHSSG